MKIILHIIVVFLLLQSNLYAECKRGSLRWDCFSEIKIENIDKLHWTQKEYVLSAIKYTPNALKYADNIFKQNREVVLNAVKYFGSAIFYADIKFRDDFEIMFTAITSNGIEYIPSCGKQSMFLKDKVLKKNSLLLKLASSRLKNNKKFCVKLLKHSKYIFPELNSKLQNDKDILNIHKEQK